MRRDALGESATGPPRHPHDAGTTMGAAPRRRLIQRSAWNRNSAKLNFALKEFSEVHVRDAAHTWSYAARLAYPDLRTMGDATRGSPIPLQAGIKAHALCEENTHLRHIQRFEPSVTEYYNFVVEPGLPVSPPPRRSGLSVACAPPRCSKPSSALPL
jgi:hypothetical protein